MQQAKTKLDQFSLDVIDGLKPKMKSLPSKYFYDEEGDRIFQQIMGMPEYYLTRAEFEILEKQTKEICTQMHAFSEPFNLIEFGAGDGLKTKLLLKYLIEGKASFTYFPVDISENILIELKEALKIEFPNLKVQPLNTDYFGALQKMKEFNNLRNITLFLGSNIGNFHLDEAASFLEKLSNNCSSGDMLLLGVDLKKDVKVITAAYNDPHGITAAFNLNLLKRMNKELGADFNIAQFDHLTFYEETSGEVLSFLVSKKDQTVHIKKLDLSVDFTKGERIHTEISRKYDFMELNTIAKKDGFEVIRHFVDSKNYFCDTLWRVK
jgi:L-histidine N-alpha-methyltransferase